VDFIFLQSGHSNFRTLERAVSQVNENLELYPNKPVLHGEVCFEGMKESSWADIQRFLFWSNVMSGTAGFSYGVEGIWQFNTEEQLFGKSPQGNVWGNAPWEECMHYEGSKQLGLAKQFLEQFEYWNFEADRSLIACQRDVDLYSPYTVKVDGKYRITYLPEMSTNNGKHKVTKLVPGKKYHYQFFNPVSGQTYEKKTIKADENGQFNVPRTPVMHDFVLVVYL
jgi:hypothetical protein